ncbi:class I SAM-dependent methyltransferase [Cognatiyoonia sp.]|uniref:class I SAM-dependent methyltransferase n=1 Tax=Cognatiyoonia sp. TaxID=2211652 RepID=UPI003F69584D
MTTLKQHLLQRIARTGPMPVADYMMECLWHPELGYYATRDPLGAEGDFTTAPEISQMFGELIGLCLAQSWFDQGQPAPFALVELGPGRGTLMADILRAASKVPGFADVAEVHLVEASEPLRAEQRTRVPDAQFHDHIDTLPDLPLFLIANEFLDALPIRQFVRDPKGWSERMIGAEGEALAFGQATPAPLEMLDRYLESAEHGEMIEHCGPLPAFVGAIGQQIARHGGVALFIDYGGDGTRGNTLQAVRAHQKVDPLEEPGQADLTAHVDFAAITYAAGTAVTETTPQGVFLERLGITPRTQALARTLDGPSLKSHIAAHRRLTHPEEMGTLFKVIGLYPDTAPPPPGLTPCHSKS